MFGSLKVCFIIAQHAPLALNDEVNCKFSNLRNIFVLKFDESLFALTNGVFTIFPFNSLEAAKIFLKSIFIFVISNIKS